MSGQKNNQHPFGSTCCRKTYGWMGVIGMNPRRGFMGLDVDLNALDGMGMNPRRGCRVPQLCVTSSVPCVNECHNGKRAYNSTATATPTHPPSFDRRHREKVFLCVIYPGRPMNKISGLNGVRHQIEKFTPTPFQPFQPHVPSVWTSTAAA